MCIFSSFLRVEDVEGQNFKIWKKCLKMSGFVDCENARVFFSFLFTFLVLRNSVLFLLRLRSVETRAAATGDRRLTWVMDSASEDKINTDCLA